MDEMLGGTDATEHPREKLRTVIQRTSLPFTVSNIRSSYCYDVHGVKPGFLRSGLDRRPRSEVRGVITLYPEGLQYP